jgi:type II secretory pathway pseudopilin PulG
MNKQHHYYSGFTIIELVLVISLMAILTIAVAPKIIEIRQETFMANRDGIVGSIHSGLHLYRAQQVVLTGLDNYPNSLDGAPNGTCIKRANPIEQCFSTVLKEGITTEDWTRYWGGLLYRHNDTNTWYWYRSGMGFFMCIANCYP